ncbi:MAG TPA: DUF512 domain-containing protein [Thermoclostridium caenicola]|uniref:DUF512 domain-containing protein n=1 Tax=Thermoclostridium caenicola TaxID=659425 RepID=UPI002B89B118|nr:DUF512 domain-containing protein [Thermoclostridium caenicola]HPO77976.1 DUF512 domain-containing protein [Thermoclostridium caenicola]HPU22315.1 DUF512 domain-containing protein [Thermoclostridium caenicola]
MNTDKIRISGVQAGSIAEELGIETGDYLVSINGNAICDVFDYRFHTADEFLTLEIEKQNGERWSAEIEKAEEEDLGLEFDNPLMDEEKSCSNKCVFCFIDQLPPGMRETLYYKDDDARLSFLFGNYITMTNLKEEEIDRIIRYRMSPINVSVHTTNPSLRVKMLNNRFAGDVLQKIKRFTDAGITVNSQIVLCPGLNDGKELDRTLRDLTDLYPWMHSISVVPVGLTRYREGLYPLEPFNRESAAQVVDQVQSWQRALMEKHGSRVVYLADEFYLMTGRPLPPYEDYEDFPQIENGVGMVASFVHEALEALSGLEAGRGETSSRQVSIATGTLFYPIMEELVRRVEEKIPGIRLTVFPVENRFFGGQVSVTGLLTGQDLLRTLKDRELGDALLLSRCMFRAGTEVLLDDLTRSDLEKALGVPVMISDNQGDAFVDNLMNIAEGWFAD